MAELNNCTGVTLRWHVYVTFEKFALKAGEAVDPQVRCLYERALKSFTLLQNVYIHIYTYINIYIYIYRYVALIIVRAGVGRCNYCTSSLRGFRCWSCFPPQMSMLNLVHILRPNWPNWT